jgi:16S rRNA (cytosine967-C5)-methyltransferase
MVAPARKIAFKVLQKVAQERANSSILLDSYFRQERPSKLDRNLSTQLVYGTLRWQKRLDYIISSFSHIPINKIDIALLIILRIALYQIFFLDRIPDAASVSEAVKLSKEIGHQGHASFANALLRKACRACGNIALPTIKQSVKDYCVITQSHPEWLVEKWLNHWGTETTINMVKANNQEAPIYIRLNTLRTDKKALQKKLKKSGIETEDCHYLPYCLKIRKPYAWSIENFLEKGYFYIMDAASQIVAHLVFACKNDIVLDACAAPGGKTYSLAMDINQEGRIISNDRHWGRIKEMKKNFNRLGISCASIVQSDIEKSPAFRSVFDRILLDAPCSALGRIRRSPEIKWNRDIEEISYYAQKQLILLEKVSDMLKSGGLLIYSVCSLEKEENEQVIQRFLEKRKRFHLAAPLKYLSAPLQDFVDEVGFIRTFPYKHDMDGFFAALLTVD